MDPRNLLAQRFEENRTHLRAVAYRMLGSLSEADDAVQEAWIRLNRSDTSVIENISGWLTTVVARVSLDMLRSRKSKREELSGVQVPDPIVTSPDATNPEQQALLADSVGLALLVVLETLTPAERLAFVLHDLFAVSFEEIAPIVGRSPMAARQLASRARRRVQGATPMTETDVSRQHEVVDAFLAASRSGDFDALVAVLDPDVVLRVEGGTAPAGVFGEVHGAAAVASRALMFASFAQYARPALVNGSAGLVSVIDGQPQSVSAFTIAGGKVVEMYVIAEAEHLAQLDLTMFSS